MAPCFAHHGCRSNSSVPSLIVQYLRFRNISSTRIAKLPVLRSTQPLPNPTVMDATGSAKEEERKRHQRKRNPKKRTLFFGRVSRLGLTQESRASGGGGFSITISIRYLPYALLIICLRNPSSACSVNPAFGGAASVGLGKRRKRTRDARRRRRRRKRQRRRR